MVLKLLGSLNKPIPIHTDTTLEPEHIDLQQEYQLDLGVNIMHKNDFVLKRFSSGRDSTLGILGRYTSPVDFQFMCFTLEDEKREIKVAGQTRIPAGRYELVLRTYGKWHDKFKADFPEGVFELKNVPGFTDVLVHTGNDDTHTEGCILVGNTATQNLIGRGLIGESVVAYKRIYPILLKELKNSGKIFINIFDII